MINHMVGQCRPGLESDDSHPPAHSILLLPSRPPESWAQTETGDPERMELWGLGLQHSHHPPSSPRVLNHRETKAQRSINCLYPS